MFGRTRSSFAWLPIAALFTGCTQPISEDDESVAGVAQAEIVTNNVALNGIHLNGYESNGIHLNGVQNNGIHLNGIHLNGIHLNDSELRGTPEGGSEIGGDAFVGVKMLGLLSDESEIELKIDDVDWSSSLSLYFYTVSYTTDGGSSWQDLCGQSGGSPIQAVLLGGRWDNVTGARIPDSTMFTIGCRMSALAKCAEWGFHPWESIEEYDALNNHHTISLAEHHQACTRMVRADYCGDGVAHTHAGTSINIWDNFKIQERDTGSTMAFEAEWSPNGAVCVKHTRWAQSSTNPDYDYIQANCSSRWAGPSSSTCGNDTYSTFVTANGYGTSLSVRALLRNESNNNIYTPPP